MAETTPLAAELLEEAALCDEVWESSRSHRHAEPDLYRQAAARLAELEELVEGVRDLAMGAGPCSDHAGRIALDQIYALTTVTEALDG